MSQPTIQLFFNPRAGSHTRARTSALCSALSACGAKVLLTKSVSEELCVDRRADHICSVGGDGTLRHVVAAVRRTGRTIPISIYPAGTVNLLAMEFDYSRDPKEFARHIFEAGAPRQHYGALIGQTPLLACASVGPDSYVVDTISPRLKKIFGRAAYLISFCKLMRRWQRSKITLVHDTHVTACEAVYIAKGRFFAGPWSFAPKARASDALLHVVALQTASRRRFLRFAWALLWHRPVDKLPGVDCFTCTDLALISDDVPPLQADGDIVTRLPTSITIEHEAFYFC